MFRWLGCGLFLLFAGALPVWSYSSSWGVQPAAAVALVFGMLAGLRFLKLI
jgi:hypothetical protein